MAPSVVASTTVKDQEKFLAAMLLQNAHLKLFASSVCDKIQQPKGSGTTCYFVRYKRMQLPLVTLTEGVPPTASTLSVEEVTGSLDQWGAYISISDIANLTTKHPLVQKASELLADNAQRVIDREIQIVMLAGTNVQYGDGSVTARASVLDTMTVTDTLLHKARITMTNNGAPPRNGPSNMKERASAQAAQGTLLGGSAYVAVTSAEITAEVMKMATSSGLWQSIVSYQNAKAAYTGEVGTYLNFRWVESNFIPKWVLLGDTTAAVASGNAFGTGTPTVTAVNGGGTLTSATTYYYKVSRKDLLRGFEEAVSIEHSTASAAAGDDESFTFAFPATAGYVYNLYFGSATGDANLKLASENIAAGATVTVTAVPASTTTAPPNTHGTGTNDPVAVHPVYIIADQALAWVGFQSLTTHVTGEGAEKTDPLGQYRTLGYKFMAKALILDQTRLLRLELPSSF